METLISLNGVNLTIVTKKIFDDLDLTINRGERIVLIGGNGKRKSTLLTVREAVLKKMPEDRHFDEGYKVDIFLEELYFPEKSLDKKIKHLRGREK